MYNFQGITREEEIYDLQWKVISGDLKNTLRDATETFTLLTYGNVCCIKKWLEDFGLRFH